MGSVGVEVEREGVGGDERVGRGEGGKEGETSCREVCSTLLRAATRKECVRGAGRGEGESVE